MADEVKARAAAAVPPSQRRAAKLLVRVEPGAEGQPMDARFAGSYTAEEYAAYVRWQAERAAARGRRSRGR